MLCADSAPGTVILGHIHLSFGCHLGNHAAHPHDAGREARED